MQCIKHTKLFYSLITTKTVQVMQLKLLELFSVLCRNYFLCFALINILSMYLTELFNAHSPLLASIRFRALEGGLCSLDSD